MIVPDGYSTPDPPARSPVSRTELPLPRPPQPWRVSTAKRVEKSLSGGAQLIVDSSSSESDHVVLWPPDPSSTEVTCSGRKSCFAFALGRPADNDHPQVLKVPAARSIESCGIRLVAVVQSSGPAYADVEQEVRRTTRRTCRPPCVLTFGLRYRLPLPPRPSPLLGLSFELLRQSPAS